MKYSKCQIGLLTLIFSCLLIIFGCGSEGGSGQPSSKKSQEPQGKKSPQVKEMLLGNSPKSGNAKKPGVSSELGAPNVMAIPPGKDGTPGITQQEIEAGKRTSKAPDIQGSDVVLPGRPGEQITRQQIEASRRAAKEAKEADPQTLVVIPSSKPGERGMTQREVEAAIKAAKQQEESETRENLVVIPPSKPGERGLTQQQVDALRPATPKDSQVEALPPSKPSGSGTVK